MQPVFIGGCDRSGTTFLGGMLGAHSRALAVPEAQFVIQVLQDGLEAENAGDLKPVFEKIKQHWRFRLWHVPVEASRVPPEVWSGTYADLIAWFVQQYGRHVNKPDRRNWVDHTPSNTRYAITLFEQFPQAKMIHLVRDGRAVAASVLPLDWGPNTIIKATNWWVEKVAHGLAAETFFGPDKVMRVRYEDLVCNTEYTLHQICTFLDWDYESQMAMGGGFSVPNYTAEQHALVRQPPDKSRLTSWRTRLTRRQREIFEHLSGDFLRQLGYDLEFEGLVQPVSAWELNLQIVNEIWRREAVNRIRRSQRIRKLGQ